MLRDAVRQRDLWIGVSAEDNRRCFTFCASVQACPGHKARVRVPIRTAGLNVDNVASLRPSRPSVSARSLTGRENTRCRSAGDEATLAPVRARDFYCFFLSSPPLPSPRPFLFPLFFPPRRDSDFPARAVSRASAGPL